MEYRGMVESVIKDSSKSQLIADVLKYLEGIKYNMEDVKRAIPTMGKICEKYKELGKGVVFSLCVYFATYMELQHRDYPNLDDLEIEGDFLKDLSKDNDELIAVANKFEWQPNVLLRIKKLSSEIFEDAKKSYLGSETVNSANALGKLNEIRLLGGQLDGIDYIYNLYDRIKFIYNLELTESNLDANNIRGIRLLQSSRMDRFIESLELENEWLKKDSGETWTRVPGSKQIVYMEIIQDVIKDYKRNRVEFRSKMGDWVRSSTSKGSISHELENLLNALAESTYWDNNITDAMVELCHWYDNNVKVSQEQDSWWGEDQQTLECIKKIDMFALCKYYLEKRSLNNIAEKLIVDGNAELHLVKDIIRDLKYSINDDLDLTAILCRYRWMPVQMDMIKEISEKVFELAKSAHFNNGKWGDINKAESELKRIKELGKELENLDYKYEDRGNVEYDYEEILRECALDMYTIKGDKEIRSQRLSNFIDEMAMGVYL